MADIGAVETDAVLKELESKITREYEQAAREISDKLREYLKKFRQKDEEWRARLEAGEITKDEYIRWRTGQLMIGKRWVQLRNALAEDYHNANLIARSTARDYLPEVYALNHNYGTYLVEHDSLVDTSYLLYNRNTVERLMRGKTKLLPDPWEESETARKLAENKDLVWNAQKITSALMQGILQGESIDQIALRLMSVTDMNINAAIRNARTMVTNAQNAGREDSFKRADKMGIELEKMWLATLDNRTRHSHRELDGVRVPVDALFPNGCSRPGDPAGPPEEVYNCRCSLIADIKGFEFDASDLSERYSEKLGDMTYEEWKNEHALTKEQEQRWIRDGQPPLSEWRESTSYKMVTNAKADAEQLERYRAVLGKDIPKTLDSFQDLKYNNSENWRMAQLDYRRRNYLINHPELALPNASVATAADTKFTGYLFNPDNPKGWAKGVNITHRLGYDISNWEKLRDEILYRCKLNHALKKDEDEYGIRYDQSIVIYGLKGKPSNMILGWKSKGGKTWLATAFLQELK